MLFGASREKIKVHFLNFHKGILKNIFSLFWKRVLFSEISALIISTITKLRQTVWIYADNYFPYMWNVNVLQLHSVQYSDFFSCVIFVLEFMECFFWCNSRLFACICFTCNDVFVTSPYYVFCLFNNVLWYIVCEECVCEFSFVFVRRFLCASRLIVLVSLF